MEPTKLNLYLKEATYMVHSLLQDHKKEMENIPAQDTFIQGTLVRVNDELPVDMGGFTAGRCGVVLEMAHHRRLIYSLFVLYKDEEGVTHGEHSAWYPHEVLTKLSSPTVETLQLVEYADSLEDLQDDEGEDLENDDEEDEDQEI
jgi:hypothetical protein